MPPVVINLKTTDDPRDVVHIAVQALAEGKLVAFPTETVYGLTASALNEQAVDQLLQAKNRQHGHALTLAVKSADDALDYVPNISTLAQRLARRCWPGPITLVLDNAHPDSALHRLPRKVREAVAPSGTVGLRVPAHPMIHAAMRLSAGPFALTSANRSGEPDAVTAEQVIQSLGDAVDLVLDDGSCKYSQPSSVVRIQKNRWKILREGVFSEDALRRVSGFMVLFVCTGNTCRSPMAELLMKRRLADKLRCTIDELEDRGVIVQSAGIAAMSGGRSSPEAVQTMRQRDLDLSEHETQPLSERLVRFADVVLTMTRGHREAIVTQWPDMSPRTKLVCRDQSDVSDPIGGPQKTYRMCADQVDEQLKGWVEEFDLGLET